MYLAQLIQLVCSIRAKIPQHNYSTINSIAVSTERILAVQSNHLRSVTFVTPVRLGARSHNPPDRPQCGRSPPVCIPKCVHNSVRGGMLLCDNVAILSLNKKKHTQHTEHALITQWSIFGAACGGMAANNASGDNKTKAIRLSRARALA